MKQGDLVQLIFDSYIHSDRGNGQDYDPFIPYLFYILSNPRDKERLVLVYCITTNEKTEFNKAYFRTRENSTGTKVKKL